jgi:hypothetical protein
MNCSDVIRLCSEEYYVDAYAIYKLETCPPKEMARTEVHNLANALDIDR